VTLAVAPPVNAAPVMPVRDTLSLVYDKWARHYNQCAECQRDEWYNPLLGETFLCAEGQELFRAWVRATRFVLPRLGNGKRHARADPYVTEDVYPEVARG
jgi:hypothetical protein